MYYYTTPNNILYAYMYYNTTSNNILYEYAL